MTVMSTNNWIMMHWEDLQLFHLKMEALLRCSNITLSEEEEEDLVATQPEFN